jgi:inorganic pyrophosphatase
MQHIEHLPHRLNTAKKECRAIIETPKGRRNKFKYDPESCLFTLSRVLPEGFTFPFDFGFIPSTLAEDGDALDAVVLMDEPAHVGCLLTVRLIGAILVEQTENGKKTQNHRLVSVPLKTFDYRDVHTLDDLNGPLVEQLTEFLARSITRTPASKTRSWASKARSGPFKWCKTRVNGSAKRTIKEIEHGFI